MIQIKPLEWIKEENFDIYMAQAMGFKYVIAYEINYDGLILGLHRNRQTFEVIAFPELGKDYSINELQDIAKKHFEDNISVWIFETENQFEVTNCIEYMEQLSKYLAETFKRHTKMAEKVNKAHFALMDAAEALQ